MVTSAGGHDQLVYLRRLEATIMRRFFLTILIFALVCLLLPAGSRSDEPKKADAKTHKANRLAREISPYLLQHAHNPVDWYPWGEEAFAKAKKEGKLVFLSIGYSSCHWCHVMERESFSNEEIAKLMNDRFVCIKVDREERPDIDNIYMTALHIMGKSGGWPMSMFLTADAKPIIGGTYWPPDDRTIEGEKVLGFKSVLGAVHKLQLEEADKLEKRAEETAERMVAELAGAARGFPLIELKRDLVTGAVDAARDEYDERHGGFGSSGNRFRGPKFPTPPILGLLQYEAERHKSADSADMLYFTLDRMAMGGIYDQLGGGFHRYSTERTWTVPHFEKMLYDNAQLVEIYATAYRSTKKPMYRRVVDATLAFIAREMTGPNGGFYSALDADSDGEEGKYYVWTEKEIDAVVAEKGEADLVKSVFGADGAPNFESKAYIFKLPKSLAEAAKERNLSENQLRQKLAPAMQKLMAARSKRNRPFLDTKALTAWNGQMIAGYAVAGRMLEEPKYTQAAAKAADFVLAILLTADGRLLRTYGAAPGGKPEARLMGYLDDYAYLVHGLLCLHDATNEQKWLDAAKTLTDKMIQFHADAKVGGFFYTANDHEKLFARSKDQFDGAQPSGNSTAAKNLIRLAAKTGDGKYREFAEKSFKAFAGTLQNSPRSMMAMAEALALYLDLPPKK
jgi:uncharacterized protein YyaL (SSP411 family)